MFLFREPSYIVRNIPGLADKKIFLTFDDGPSTSGTAATLELLNKYNAHATFFVIGAKAISQPELIQRMLKAQHSIYSHSDQHQYDNYFKSESIVADWLTASLTQLNGLLPKKTNLFRSPAGVLTPPLLRAANKLRVSLIMWNQRFYDSTWKLTPKKILKKSKKFKSGDIVLLHDHQKPENLQSYLESLEVLLQDLKKQGFEIAALKESDVNFVLFADSV